MSALQAKCVERHKILNRSWFLDPTVGEGSFGTNPATGRLLFLGVSRYVESFGWGTGY